MGECSVGRLRSYRSQAANDLNVLNVHGWQVRQQRGFPIEPGDNIALPRQLATVVNGAPVAMAFGIIFVGIVYGTFRQFLTGGSTEI